MEESPKSPSIPQLFTGKSVFVTGATGFLGKVLIEKLLRSCPGIQEVFILLRPSKKGDVPQRLRDFLEHHVFDRLRNERSDALQKIRALSGDVALDNLGLRDWQLQKITEVSFIFHCAANVRFDEDPRTTLITNLLGVKNVLDVCKSCTQLKALVHVSTSFSFCNQPEVSENLYPESVTPHQIIDTLQWMSSEECRIVCNHYARDRPSVYHFSKALAEHLVAESEDTLPAIIVRPSIVTASVNEPVPGWIDNYNGPSGFIAVCGKGIVKTLLVKPDIYADWVPVDIVANTLIAAAHYIAVNSRQNNPVLTITSPARVPIINCTCPEHNMLTWMEIIRICLPFLVKYPSTEVYGKAGGTVTPCPFLYTMRCFVSHYIPALFIDGASCLIFKRPRLVCLYRNIHRVMGHLQHYTTHSFIFRSPNMSRLIELMEYPDNELFPIDQSELDWTRYMENYVLGVRRYFLREDDETLPEARVKMMRLHYFWLAVRISSLFGIYIMIHRKWKRHVLKKLSISLFSTPLFSAINFLQHKIVSSTK